jgi:hypothetical protein
VGCKNYTQFSDPFAGEKVAKNVKTATNNLQKMSKMDKKVGCFLELVTETLCVTPVALWLLSGGKSNDHNDCRHAC